MSDQHDRTLPHLAAHAAGPDRDFGLAGPGGRLADPGAGAIRVTGRLTDGAGQPVPDGVIETWQADAAGRFARPDAPRDVLRDGFNGFGRCLTDHDGRFEFVTIKPGATGDGQAPHIDVSVLARGLLDRLVTRIYFPDEAAANALDPVLAQVPPRRRSTLIAIPAGPAALRFDIRLQGEGETVFLTV